MSLQFGYLISSIWHMDSSENRVPLSSHWIIITMFTLKMPTTIPFLGPSNMDGNMLEPFPENSSKHINPRVSHHSPHMATTGAILKAASRDDASCVKPSKFGDHLAATGSVQETFGWTKFCCCTHFETLRTQSGLLDLQEWSTLISVITREEIVFRPPKSWQGCHVAVMDPEKLRCGPLCCKQKSKGALVSWKVWKTMKVSPCLIAFTRDMMGLHFTYPYFKSMCFEVSIPAPFLTPSCMDVGNFHRWSPIRIWIRGSPRSNC